MTSREKAYWLNRVNPYKLKYLADAFKEGARSFWTGEHPQYVGNSRERVAFYRGYSAAQEEAKTHVS